MAGILGIPPKYAHDLIACALGRKPRGIPQTQEKESKKCSGLRCPALTPFGYVAGDGRLYHDRMKALRITRDVAKREEVLRNLQLRENARLDRLKEAAKSGDIAFTKDGVFETKPCPSCGVYHKVPYVCGVEEPCPNSHLAKYPLKISLKPLEKVRDFIRMRGVANASRIFLSCKCACVDLRTSDFQNLIMRVRDSSASLIPNRACVNFYARTQYNSRCKPAQTRGTLLHYVY